MVGTLRFAHPTRRKKAGRPSSWGTALTASRRMRPTILASSFSRRCAASSGDARSRAPHHHEELWLPA